MAAQITENLPAVPAPPEPESTTFDPEMEAHMRGMVLFRSALATWTVQCNALANDISNVSIDVDTVEVSAATATTMAAEATASANNAIEANASAQSAATAASQSAIAAASAAQQAEDLALGNIPGATDSVAGTVELATTAETQAGTDASRAVTPAAGAATYVARTGMGVAGGVATLGDDGFVHAEQLHVTADQVGALPASGGAMTGEISCEGNPITKAKLTDWQEAVQSLGSVSGSVTVDISQGNIVEATIAGNTVFAFANVPPAGVGCGIMFWLTFGSTLYTASFQNAVWPASLNNAAPEFSANTVANVGLQTINNGATWHGSAVLGYSS